LASEIDIQDVIMETGKYFHREQLMSWGNMFQYSSAPLLTAAVKSWLSNAFTNKIFKLDIFSFSTCTRM
jgi:hypothetical protein